MEEETRPVVRQVLLAYAAAYLLVLAALIPLVWLLRLPPPVFSALVILVSIVDSALVAYRAARACWVHITERYVVGDDYVIVERSWASKTSGIIPMRNIAEARAVMPLLLRMVGVGLVVIETNDGSRHVLYNVKRPEGIVGRIKPVPAKEPVTRPTGG